MAQEVKLSDKPDLKKDFNQTSFKEWKKQVEKDLKGESSIKNLSQKLMKKLSFNLSTQQMI